MDHRIPAQQKAPALAAIMKILLVSLALLHFSCIFESHVSGVIIDEKTGLPVQDVTVRTIKDLNGRQLEFAETKSSWNGKFDLRFSTKSVRDRKVSVELSKLGYQTNIYICNEENSSDTLIFKRQ